MSKSIVACDVGFGNTKTVWGDPGPGGLGQHEIIFDSLVPPCYSLQLQKAGGGTGGSLDRVVVEVDGRHFYAGPKASLADGTRILDPNFIERVEYRALLAGALHYYLRGTDTIAQSIDCLVLGLPVSSFASRRAALKSIGARVHRVPVPAHLQARAGGRDTIEMVAKKVLVLPQPVGALRFALNGSGGSEDDPFEMHDEVCLVIDPGFNTFDWFLSQGMDPDLESSGSFAGGVSQVVRAVAHAAGMSLGVGALNFIGTERALTSGVLMYEGRRHDFTPFRAVAHSVAQRVVDEFLLAFNFQASGVQRVILTGGGALHYLEALRQRLPGFDVQVSADAVMDNARGFWLLGQDVLGVDQEAA